MFMQIPQRSQIPVGSDENTLISRMWSRQMKSVSVLTDLPTTAFSWYDLWWETPRKVSHKFDNEGIMIWLAVGYTLVIVNRILTAPSYEEMLEHSLILKLPINKEEKNSWSISKKIEFTIQQRQQFHTSARICLLKLSDLSCF